MGFDFTVTARTAQWRDRIGEFLRDQVIPAEQQAFAAGVDDALRLRLQAAARQAGVFAPQVAEDLGGGGFAFDDVAVLLEEAGTSLLGPLALGCAAPDEGNVHLLDRIASPEQRDRYLRPLAAGQVRSCFAMTEPPPGAGSDPSALRTRARRVDGGWRVDGVKHLITGAEGAAFAILMAAGGRPDGQGSTMFLVDTDTPGWQLGAHARTIDATMVGGHCEVRVDDLFVPDEQVLGEPGEGFRYAQVRLAPARLTHCMRWLGAARRAHEIATDRAVTRELFGSPLADLGMAQQMIADNEIDLHAARALLWQTSWEIAQGNRGTESSSRTKVFVSEAVGRVVDRAVQLCGGLGTSDDLVVGRIYADVRAFRIYDGSSETHRMSIAKRAARRARDRRTG
ncbi:acyl-CoA dehydrogenase family protein [Micromonospora sp. NPDC047074]|uniref:acyl-CoA dehydrogenase family protein n=1 Tax=Micromonospora sp. NPDC047074 TaxID=3154339 RepID=UPI0033C355FF